MTARVDHVGVAASDVPRTVPFYVALLDGRVEPMPGHSLVVRDGVRVAVSPRRDGDPAGYARGHHLALGLSSTERDSVMRRLATLGADVVEVSGRIYTRDPDGLTLELLFA